VTELIVDRGKGIDKNSIWNDLHGREKSRKGRNRKRVRRHLL
jgi:hypothetical protein